MVHKRDPSPPACRGGEAALHGRGNAGWISLTPTRCAPKRKLLAHAHEPAKWVEALDVEAPCQSRIGHQSRAAPRGRRPERTPVPRAAIPRHPPIALTHPAGESHYLPGSVGELYTFVPLGANCHPNLLKSVHGT